MVSNETSKDQPTPTTSFIVGEHVRWKHLTGFVNFVSEYYITICVCSYTKDDPHCLHRTQKVCVICYPMDWKDVEHENQK